jgi:TMEM175 potassium channel family protein
MAESETTRLEAFSDGVFAIAITLLILEIRLPRVIPTGGLPRALAALWPSYLAFLASFLTIGVMWINHHRLFTLIEKCDDALLGLNLLLLLGVTFVPFPTAVVAEHIAGSEARSAAIFYNATFIYLAVVFNILWRYASRHLLGGDVDHRLVHGISRQYALGPLYYVAALLVAMVSAAASVGLNVALAIFFAIPAVRFHRSH